MSGTPRPQLEDTQPLPPPLAAGPHGYAPLPVQPVEYSTPLGTHPPGVLTAVGVTSIVIAGISILFGLSEGIQTLVFAELMPKSATALTSRAMPAMPAGPMQTGSPAATVTTSSTGITSAGVPATGPATAPATAAAGLTPSEIQSLVQHVQRISGNGLSAAQTSALKTALQKNSPPVVSPAYAYSPVVAVDKATDGSVGIQFNGGGALALSAGGQVLAQTAVGTPPVGLPRIGLAAGGLVGADALASLALAFLLLIAGIQVFGNSRGAVKLHRIFAVLKIPTGVIGAAAIAMMYDRMIGSIGVAGIRPAGVANTAQLFEIGYFIFYALISCAYPIALLIVLRPQMRGRRCNAATDSAEPVAPRPPAR